MEEIKKQYTLKAFYVLENFISGDNIVHPSIHISKKSQINIQCIYLQSFRLIQLILVEVDEPLG